MEEVLKTVGLKREDGDWNRDTLKGIAIGVVMAIVVRKLIS